MLSIEEASIIWNLLATTTKMQILTLLLKLSLVLALRYDLRNYLQVILKMNTDVYARKWYD